MLDVRSYLVNPNFPIIDAPLAWSIFAFYSKGNEAVPQVRYFLHFFQTTSRLCCRGDAITVQQQGSPPFQMGEEPHVIERPYYRSHSQTQ